MLKNNRFLKAIDGENIDRPPVWMMRQAGRYLPEFIALRNEYDFFTRCQTPELAAEITMMPINRFPLDAAILFSDILVVPQAMGLDFKMKESIGPFLENPIRTVEQINKIEIPDVKVSLDYVFKAIDITLELLKNEIPLIGFAGSPWTIFCYSVEGHGSKTFDKAKSFAFQEPEATKILLQKITDTTILYLNEKVKHGVHALQIFDSWGGVLSPYDYNEYSWKYINQIINKLHNSVPVIVFGKGCWFALEKMAKSKASVIGIDWTVEAKFARKHTKSKTLQGNFDPSKLLTNPKTIKKEVTKMIDAFGVKNYIANLGHGILPNVPLENAAAFIEAVVNYQKI